jgi:hypothetical protein
MDAPHDLVDRALYLPLFHKFAHGPPDGFEALFQNVIGEIPHQHIVTGLGADLSDPSPHQTGAGNEYFLDFHWSTLLVISLVYKTWSSGLRPKPGPLDPDSSRWCMGPLVI